MTETTADQNQLAEIIDRNITAYLSKMHRTTMQMVRELIEPLTTEQREVALVELLRMRLDRFICEEIGVHDPSASARYMAGFLDFIAEHDWHHQALENLLARELEHRSNSLFA